MSYIGRVKPVETTASVLRSTYTGDGTTTTYNLPNTVSDETAIIATINGVVQQDAAYTTNGSQILFSAAPASGDAIELRVVSGVGLGYAPPDGSVVTGKLADGAVTNGKIADGGVSAAKLATGAARANFGAGAVLQVVNMTYNTQVTSTSATFVDTGLAANITPTSSTSKILIIANINGVYHGNSLACFGAQLVRNSTSICIFEAISGNSNTSQMGGCSAMNFVDSPNTTSTITYKVQFNNPNASGTTYIQTTNGGQITTSALTLMEIAA